ncbi:MAG: TAXI family TRAP transporter solute-binding subunit [Alphaproteobacteria bacterium]
MRLRSMKVALFFTCLLGCFTNIAPVAAQVTGQTNVTPIRIRARSVPPKEAEESSRLNKWSIGLAGGPIETTDIKFASDISVALSDGPNLRIVTTLTPGSIQNVKDLLYLQGMDAGLVSADVFDDIRKEGEIKNVEKRIQYVSQICVNSFQLLVSADIKTLKDLNGKKISIPTKGSSTASLALKVFKRNGLKVKTVEGSIAAGLEQLKSGEVSGVVAAFSKGTPTIFSFIKADSGLHLLPVSFDKFMDDYYVPIYLSNSDYPNLIPPGAKIETIGTPVVLAIYNWPKNHRRFRKVERFIQYYFEKFDRLRQPPFHPAWRNVNLAAKVPGWKRYWYAKKVLKDMIRKVEAKAAKAGKDGNAGKSKLSRVEQEMLATVPNEEQKKKLKEFFEWKRKQQQ